VKNAATTTNKIPLGEKGLLNRITKHIAERGLQLVRRDRRAWLVDGANATPYDSLEALGRAVGVVGAYEEVVL
jgi:hypothetical protein